MPLAAIIIALGAVVLAIVDHLLQAIRWPEGLTRPVRDLARAVVDHIIRETTRTEESVGLATRKRVARLEADLAVTPTHGSAHVTEPALVAVSIEDVNTALHAGVRDRARRVWWDPMFHSAHNLTPAEVHELAAITDDELDGWIRELVAEHNIDRDGRGGPSADDALALERVFARPALYADDAAEAALRAAIPGSRLPPRDS